MVKLKGLNEMFTEAEINAMLKELHPDMDEEVDFEAFLRVSPLIMLIERPFYFILFYLLGSSRLFFLICLILVDQL